METFNQVNTLSFYEADSCRQWDISSENEKQKSPKFSIFNYFLKYWLVKITVVEDTWTHIQLSLKTDSKLETDEDWKYKNA